MVSSQIIKGCLEQLRTITKTEFCVQDTSGKVIAQTEGADTPEGALTTGFAHTEQILTAAGPGFENPCVLRVPFGITWKTVLQYCRFKGGSYEPRVNSPINGAPAIGIIRPDQECVFAFEKQEKRPDRCLSCGLCADACPVSLRPFRILTARNYATVKEMSSECLRCGCCSYVCPSDIPLESLIAKYGKKESDAHD